MRILFTGASSFSGYWFVRTLSAAGHEVFCPLQGGLERYDGVRKKRIENLLVGARLVPHAPFGTDAFRQLVRENGPWDMLCHHAADVTNYKGPGFNAHRALENNTLNLQIVLGEFKQVGLKGVVLTGSVFENDEGLGNEPLRAFSPYGLSKGMTWQFFRYYCDDAGVPLGKFVIANPFGPFEEPRFTAYLMRTWKDGKRALVKTPDYLRDNIHVELLAAAYTRFAERVAGGKHSLLRLNASGYVENQGAFAYRMAREVRTRLGWTCELDLAKQEDFSEPLFRVNSEPAVNLVPEWNEETAWDAYVDFYASQSS